MYPLFFFSDFKNICRKYHSRLKNGETISDNQIKYLNNDGDKDCIRFRNFILAHHLSVDGSLELKLRRLFQYCDANGDGLITRQDIRNTLSKWQHIPASIEESLAKFTENTYNEDEFLEKCMAINKMI